MAASLLLLLDDIASILDDVATLTKVAAHKTAGVLGDDLALNAQQVTGIGPARELPVVWAVAKGSAWNKALLVPAALAISWLAPWAIPPLLVAGGAFLCYEGAEKILHALMHRAGHEAAAHHDAAAHHEAAVSREPATESGRIAGAIRTDFILSAEIIVITLGIVAGAPLATRVGVLAAVAVLMTIGVYGLVAAIVKLDDLGLALAKSRSRTLAAAGRWIVAAAPWLMRSLSVAGTAAMFLVGGGIVVHQVPALHALVHDWLSRLGGDAHAAPSAGLGLAAKAAEAIVGLALGMLLVGAIDVGRRGRRLLGRTA